MTDPTVSAATVDVLEDLARAVLIRPARVAPSLTVVVGQPGSGTRGQVAALAAVTGGVVVHPDEVAGLLPEFWDTGRLHPLDARTLLADRVDQVTGELLAVAIGERVPVVIGDPTGDADTVATLLGTFAGEGFPTRLVAVGARRSETLLSTLSAYLHARRRGLPAQFTSRAAHEAGWDTTETITQWATTTPVVDRVTVVDRDGAVLFDGHRNDPGGVDRAVRVLDDARHAAWSTRDAGAWLSEVRRVTEYAREARELSPQVADVLLEVQLLALREVLPDLPVRGVSPVRDEQEARIAAQIVALRDLIPTPQPAPAPAAPRVEVPWPGQIPDTTPVPEREGPSL